MPIHISWVQWQIYFLILVELGHHWQVVPFDDVDTLRAHLQNQVVHWSDQQNKIFIWREENVFYRALSIPFDFSLHFLDLFKL